jgi:hypothetical protein
MRWLSSNIRHWSLVRLFCVLTLGIVIPEVTDTNTAIAQVQVRVETISGEPVHGRFLRLTEDQLQLRDAAGVTKSIDTATVLGVSATDFDGIRVPQISRTPWILLSTGDRLRMTPLIIDDEKIVARWSEFSILPPVSLPLELCRGIAMSVSSAPIEQGRSFDRLLNHRENVDRITLSNGDRVDGEFVSLTNEEFTLETSIGKVQTRIAQTRLLAFNPDLVSEPDAVDAFAILTLSDGSTLHVRKLVSDGDLIIAESVGGFEISVPVTAFRSIRFYDPVRVDLTRLKPIGTIIGSYLSMRREPKTNRNVIGGFMSLRGQLMPVGFGATSGTAITWGLERRYQQLRATVGIDDAAQGAGSVVFQVVVDGSVAWQSEIITGASPPVEIPPIDLTGADKLTLNVQFADRGNVLDYANWCQPVLIRKPNDTSQE